MPMKQTLIEIQIHGFTSDGKTHVCNVIKKALIAEYGAHTNVVSRVLSKEPESQNVPSENVIFSIEEFNHGSMATHKND